MSGDIRGDQWLFFEGNPPQPEGRQSRADDLIDEVCAELDQRAVPYLLGEVTHFVRLWHSDYPSPMTLASLFQFQQRQGETRPTLDTSAIDESLIAEVCAELKRQGQRLSREEVRSYVAKAFAGRFLWSPPEGPLHQVAFHIATRWSEANNRQDWEDAG